MIPVVLSLSCPKLRAVKADMALMQRWEVLRRSAEPMTVHQLAEACGVSDAVAQHSLDALADAGLVVRLRASLRRRGIAYRSISERVIVEWDAESDADLAALLQNRQAIRALSRSIIDRNDTAEMRGMPGLSKVRGHQSFMLTRAESEAMAQALRSAWETITRIEAEARKRSLAPSKGRGASAAKQGASETVPYHVALEFRPLKAPELPISDIGAWEKKALARELAYLSSAPDAVLAPRELEIAKRLAAGESRPQVAQALGVSVNTIASATKRIYAKLGVRNRAEFATRMKEHS